MLGLTMDLLHLMYNYCISFLHTFPPKLAKKILELNAWIMVELVPDTWIYGRKKGASATTNLITCPPPHTDLSRTCKFKDKGGHTKALAPPSPWIEKVDRQSASI